MKGQRWPGDYELVSQEFANARHQEQLGMRDANMSHGNDYLAMSEPERLDRQQRYEMEPSWTTQLDTTGMQPHAREYLERDVTSMRSRRKFSVVSGQVIEHCDGIQFTDLP